MKAGVFSAWAASNLSEALTTARQHATLPSSSGLGDAIRAGLQSGCFDEVMQFAAQESDPTFRSAFMRNIKEFALVFPKFPVESMEKLVSEFPSGRERDQLVSAVIHRIAASDPDRAIQTWQATEDPSAKVAALPALVNSMLSTNPGRAVNFYKENLEGADPKIIERTLQVIAAQAPAQAIQLLAESPVLDPDRTVFKGILSRSVLTQPEWAFRQVEQLPENERRQTEMDLVRSLVTSDGRRAIEQAAKMAEGEVRNFALREGAGAWGLSEPTEAEFWLAGLTAGPDRNEAISGFADGIRVRDPQSAASWAVRIDDTAARERPVEGAVRQWLRGGHPEEVASWVRTAAIDERLRQKLLSIVLPPKP